MPRTRRIRFEGQPEPEPRRLPLKVGDMLGDPVSTVPGDDKYQWEDGMGEISGFGGSYEAGRRTLVKAGLEWLDEHPDADPKFRGYDLVYGIIDEVNDDAKALSKAMTDAANVAFPGGGVTGAMHQASVTAVLWIHHNGWPAYKAAMKGK